MEDNRTETELINEAWQAHNACNLSGVVHSFSRAMTRLRALNPRLGTKDINEHIVSKLYADKIMSLSGSLPLDLRGYGITEIDEMHGIAEADDQQAYEIATEERAMFKEF
jgi:hypothetical protein